MDDCFVWRNGVEWKWLFVYGWFMCFIWCFVFVVNRISFLKLYGEVKSWREMVLYEEWI